MAQRGPTRPTARIEEAIGFVGTFGVLFLGVTVFCEVTGRPALGWALTLLAAVVAIVLLDRWRVRVLRRHREATSVVDGVGAAPAGTGPAHPRAHREDGHAHLGWDDVEPGRRRPEHADPATHRDGRASLVRTGRPTDAGRPSNG